VAVVDTPVAVAVVELVVGVPPRLPMLPALPPPDATAPVAVAAADDVVEAAHCAMT